MGTEQEIFKGGDPVDLGRIHQPVVLMLDTSESMGWGSAPYKIDQLNTGLRAFLHSWRGHELGTIIDAAIVAFNCTPELVHNFHPVAEIADPAPLRAAGTTSMGAALNYSLDLIDEYKQRLKMAGVEYRCPWIICITDGEPTDRIEVQQATSRLQTAETRNAVVGYCFGVDGFSSEKMAETFDKERILLLKNHNFNELFEFLHNSLVVTSQADGGSKVGVSMPSDLVRPDTFTFQS
ncbi:MAG: hypothetical protein FWC86_01545 [Coriobacteriia bacterium]|nr:hypothetical protein [Coriobacteriia bacterium]